MSLISRHEGRYRLQCPICGSSWNGSDYLDTVFDDDRRLWLANMITHYRHEHREWDKQWRYIERNCRDGEYERQKRIINEQAKRQILRKCKWFLVDHGFTPADFGAMQGTTKQTRELAESTLSGAMTGINVRDPFATLLASGRKQVETRRYKPPQHLVGNRVAIIQTGLGSAMIVGYAHLDSYYQYESKDHWHADSDRHRVPPGNEFDWVDDSPRFAWEMSNATMLDNPIHPPAKRGRLYVKNCTIN